MDAGGLGRFPGERVRMPFKAKVKSRHHIPPQKHRIINWRDYDASLKRRGDLLVWVSEDVIAGWKAQPRTTPGGQAVYSPLAIQTALSLRAVFHMPLRQTEGLLGSLLRLLEVKLSVPDHTTLSRRGKTLKVARAPRIAKETDGPLHLIVDSTGLKFHGPGEWTIEKHGTKRRKSWRVFHLGTDAQTGEIVAHLLTSKEADDAHQVGRLLDQLDEPLAAFLGDGAYDREVATSAILQRHPDASIIVPPLKTAVLSEHAQTDPTQRDRHLLEIGKHGRSGWQKHSGYTVRSRVENSIGRFKQVLGESLRSKDHRNQATEIDIAVHVLNRMLSFGRPYSVRIA